MRWSIRIVSMERENRKEVKCGFGGKWKTPSRDVLTDSGQVPVSTENRDNLDYGIVNFKTIQSWGTKA